MKLKLALKGSTILEVLIATTLIALSIIAALSLNNNSQKTSSYARDLTTATTYNTQAIDWFRNLRSEMGWGEFYAAIFADNGGNPTYCLATLPTDTSGFIALSNGICTTTEYITGTTLIRQASLVLSPDSLTVVVTTSWENDTHSTSTDATITNW